MKSTLLVMAAGMGSRFGGLKQVEPIGPNGETILDYSVYDALRAGFGRVVFVIRRDFEGLFRDRVGSRFSRQIEIRYVFQEIDRLPQGFCGPTDRQKPWGTGHAVWCARDEIDGPFAVINADDFYGREAFAALAAKLDCGLDESAGDSIPQFAMVGYRLADTLSEHGSVSRGICVIGHNRRLEKIEETIGIEKASDGAGLVRMPDGHERLLSPETIVSMNCWGFTAQVFEILNRSLMEFLGLHYTSAKAEFHLPAAIEQAVRGSTAEVMVLPVRGSWFGVTHPADKPRVVASIAKLIDAGDYPRDLWA